MKYLYRLLLAIALMIGGADSAAAQAGNWAWARQAGGAGADAGKGIGTDRAGHVYVGGVYQQAAAFGSQRIAQAGTNGFPAKYDSAGTALWARSIANSGLCSVEDIAVDPSGNAYLIGSFVGTATFGPASFTSVHTDSLLPDGFVVKLNPQGVVQWAKHIESSPFSSFQSIVPAAIRANAVGEVVICGGFERELRLDTVRIRAQATAVSAFLLKFTPAGEVAWHAEVKSAEISYATDIEVADDGYIYTVGFVDGFATLVNAQSPSFPFYAIDRQSSAFLAFHRSTGRLSSGTQAAIGQGFSVAQSVASDQVGNVYLTGYFSGITTFTNNLLNPLTARLAGGEAFVVKLRRNRTEFVWERQSFGTFTSQGTAIAVDTAGTVYLSGSFGGQLTFDSVTTLVAADTINAYLAAFDANSSTPRWAQAGGKCARYELVPLALDRRRRLFITGQFTGSTRIGGTGLPGNGGRPEVFLARYDPARPLALPPPVTGRGPLVVYPNPVSSHDPDARLLVMLPITSGFHGKAVRVRLLNALGQPVASQQYLPEAMRSRTELPLPLGILPAGLYSLVLEDATRRWTQRLVIE
ncbi:MAG: SBBP repeat-containing protein [Hymenobacteraceae bacterium]|nr:SBBP repeat-containing protein [Hymenobacteraceae bacterium]